MTSSEGLSVMLLLLLVTRMESTPEMEPTFDKVVTLMERTSQNTILSRFNCSDPDSDPVRVFIKSIIPAVSCTSCFTVLDCAPEKCLHFIPGILDYTKAQSYVINVACTDNTEPEVSEVIQVNIIPNRPPEFVPTSSFVSAPLTSKLLPGSKVYDVKALDLDGDSISYSMTVLPASSSGNYVIDSSTGKIRTTVDMRMECRNSVSFLVTISDGVTVTGPLVIDSPITNANVAPVAVNLDAIVQIPETATGDIYTMLFNDPNMGDTVTYTMSTSNTLGQNQFTYGAVFNGEAKIKVKGKLDYEMTNLRRTDFVISATDGFCSSPLYTLTLEVTDVNESPTISPVLSSLQVCEGKGEFIPTLTVTDPDTDDSLKWSFDTKTSNSEGYFGIDEDTGNIRTLVDYDVDVGKPITMLPSKTFYVKVEDKGGLSATATVSVSFLDCNDNAPVFDTNQYYTASATECQAPGSKLLTITAKDKDSTREQNNDIYYEGSGGSVIVNALGEVIVQQALPAGSVDTFHAYAYDRGVTPGPKRSASPAVISVRFTPCPTPPPSLATAAPQTTATVTTTTSTPMIQKQEDNLAWIIIAALLGTLLLGLMTFMLWRYGNLCLHSCQKLNCKKTCCRPETKRLLTPRAERRPPMKRALRPPTEQIVNVPDPIGPGFLFGFWKERYPDDDFKSQPDRIRLPSPGDMEAHYPHTIDPVLDPLSPSVTEPEMPKKKCIIM
ncbi:unnamed protein product [Lymnaea stagnalis]|uniref:Cadherin domain-containing protein n=1 Tax=Lymnaea stagnalis TaxID=6523 RepID=A0AAV2I9Y4_LYMST